MESNYIEKCSFTIIGSPKTKSNHNLVNAQGKKILPKNSEYALYEKVIVNSIFEQVGEKQFKGKVVCVIKTYFKHKERHPDLNNMPKSICDGIEKSGLIINDRNIVAVYLEEFYDYDNPRVEVDIYDYLLYKPSFSIIERPKEEILEIENKPKKKKAKKSNKELNCSVCGKSADINHLKPISSKSSKKKEYICFGCILSGC